MVARILPFALILAMLLTGAAQQAPAQGIATPGVGPINRSMAGAAVAAPLDAAGAINWNPATISALPCSQMLFGSEFLHIRTEVSSSVPAGRMGFGVPAADLSGRSASQTGVNVLPTLALVHHVEDTPWTLGLGMLTIGGFGTNYAGSLDNPVLTPPLPNGIGSGRVYSNFALAQIAPTVSAWLTERLAVGFSPTISMGSLSVVPGAFAAPDDANGNGFPTYPAATCDRMRWGLGFQLGVYYVPNCVWSFGASLKSPQWLEEFEFNASDEIGAPRKITLDVDYPMIVSLGAAYRGIPRTLVALDVRYVDYDNTNGLGDTAAFDANGALTGFGWNSVVAAALGIQYQLNECHSVRCGYLFADNPIPANVTSLNVSSSAIYEHAVFVGGSSKLVDPLTFSWAYYHTFPSDITGEYLTPFGAIPGSSVRIEQSIDALIVGLHIDY